MTSSLPAPDPSSTASRDRRPREKNFEFSLDGPLRRCPIKQTVVRCARESTQDRRAVCHDRSQCVRGRYLAADQAAQRFGESGATSQTIIGHRMTLHGEGDQPGRMRTSHAEKPWRFTRARKAFLLLSMDGTEAPGFKRQVSSWLNA